MKCSPTIAALAGLLLAMPAVAEGLSVAAPTDLTKPQFDTTTPQHEVSGVTDEAAKTIVAEIDGQPITLAQVGDTIRSLPADERQRPFEELYPMVLERLIVREALVIRAHATGLDDEPAVRREIQAATDRILSDDYASRQTAARISEETMQAKYRDEVAGKPGPEEVRFRTIMVQSEQEALDLIKKIQSGSDFASLAKGVRTGPDAPVWGEVPFTALDRLTPEIGAVAFAMAPGQLAPYPVRSGNAWYVIQVEERRTGPSPSYEAARPRLLLMLQQLEVRAVAKEALTHSIVREFPITGKPPSDQP